MFDEQVVDHDDASYMCCEPNSNSTFRRFRENSWVWCRGHVDFQTNHDIWALESRNSIYVFHTFLPEYAKNVACLTGNTECDARICRPAFCFDWYSGGVYAVWSISVRTLPREQNITCFCKLSCYVGAVFRDFCDFMDTRYKLTSWCLRNRKILMCGEI
jgi:hypothetical protein